MNGALVLGVNGVDPGLYGIAPPPLRAAERDAWAVADHLASRGFSLAANAPLVGHRATREALRMHLVQASRVLTRPHDVFLLYFAGHGSRVRDPSGSEHDGHNETWCLYDGQVIDHALYLALGCFEPQVQVLVVADCCYSGADDLWTSPKVPPPVAAAARALPASVAQGAYAHLAWSCDIQPRLARGQREQVLRADVELLAACRESELAFEGPRLGYFTDAFLQVSTANPRLPMRHLEYEVNQRTPRCQTPYCVSLSRHGVGAMPF